MPHSLNLKDVAKLENEVLSKGEGVDWDTETTFFETES